MHMHMHMDVHVHVHMHMHMHVHVHISPESEQLLDERLLHLLDSLELCPTWLQPAHLAVAAVVAVVRYHALLRRLQLL